MWYFTDGRSGTAPPRTRTTECSWRLWPMPGMYAVTSIPLERRTRAIFRRAEFGFFGVMVRTTVQTPRFCGAPRWSLVWRPVSEFQVVRSAGVSTFFFCEVRPLRTSCEIVGTVLPLLLITEPPARAHANALAWARLRLDSPDRGAAPCGVGPRAQRGRRHKIATGPMREMTAPYRAVTV